jgi:hypothetical protein
MSPVAPSSSTGLAGAPDRADSALGVRGPGASLRAPRHLIEGGDPLSRRIDRVAGSERFASTTVTVPQARNRAGLPWIIAGSALVVGGAIVGDDIGTILMAGGVVGVAYGMYIYF